MYILKVTGQYYSREHRTPEPAIADMLRYDEGEMVDWKNLGPIFPGSGAYSNFEAEVHTNHYTPERWRSFSLKTELVRKEPGKASCSYPDSESVQRAIQEHR